MIGEHDEQCAVPVALILHGLDHPAELVVGVLGDPRHVDLLHDRRRIPAVPGDGVDLAAAPHVADLVDAAEVEMQRRPVFVLDDLDGRVGHPVVAAQIRLVGTRDHAAVLGIQIGRLVDVRCRSSRCRERVVARADLEAVVVGDVAGHVAAGRRRGTCRSTGPRSGRAGRRCRACSRRSPRYRSLRRPLRRPGSTCRRSWRRSRPGTSCACSRRASDTPPPRRAACTGRNRGRRR